MAAAEKLFSIDLRIYATAYVRAADDKEAMVKLRQITSGNTGLEFSNDYQFLEEGICMDGRPFPALFGNTEDIALSPVMTIDKQFLSIMNLQEVELEPEGANDP